MVVKFLSRTIQKRMKKTELIEAVSSLYSIIRGTECQQAIELKYHKEARPPKIDQQGHSRIDVIIGSQNHGEM